ncbi:glycosyltransferase family 9 protein [Maridesulfovibrio sp.]|uniref:glycosyltransferase family 9 protein n=1 Tax=Maridesulfovibrio sp. TaxID=2795000 RepID=UPI002A18D25C|nr:glycosyltransferase family 9 protein [Maridesulfovibrio sp.]
MKALVINLTRFGDLLQTQPVISALAAEGYETAMVCLKNFASTTGLMRDINEVFPLPGAALLAALDRDWHEALRIYDSYCSEIAERFAPDLVINLTPSIPARLVALRLGKGCSVRGFAVDSFGFNADTSRWAQFLQMASANRGASPFNIVDLFSRVAGIERPVPFRLADSSPTDRIAAVNLLETDAPGVEGFIGFQPGASEDRRRWPVERFRELGSRVWKEMRRVPVLLGTASERELGDRIMDGADFPAVNLMGRTSLPELSAVLRRLDLLVTNDTGTMHLAAGAGTPVVAVFLATAQPWDTGPAAEGCLCLEPDIECHPCPFGVKCTRENECRHRIGADSIFHAVTAFIREGKWPEMENMGVRAYLSGRDDAGFMLLSSLSGHEKTDPYRWIFLQREIYRRFLDDEDLSGASIGDYRFSSEFISRLSVPLSECRDLLFLLSRQVMLLQSDPMKNIKVKFLANFQRIHDILSSCPELSVLAALWELESRGQESLDGLVTQLKSYSAIVGALSASFE